ncbi:MAG: hypothetical protein HQ592_17985 [Planctomycetes bacterium]|nr:hypothetical protein [Planctomycetota bacterium]
MKIRPLSPAAIVLSGVLLLAVLVSGPGAALAETEAVRIVNQFDDLRALGMRALLRPFMKRGTRDDEASGKLLAESPAPTRLVIGASDPGGLEAGVDNLIKLIREE